MGVVELEAEVLDVAVEPVADVVGDGLGQALSEVGLAESHCSSEYAYAKDRQGNAEDRRI